MLTKKCSISSTKNSEDISCDLSWRWKSAIQSSVTVSILTDNRHKSLCYTCKMNHNSDEEHDSCVQILWLFDIFWIGARFDTIDYFKLCRSWDVRCLIVKLHC